MNKNIKTAFMLLLTVLGLAAINWNTPTSAKTIDNQYAKHNEFYKVDHKNISNIDGYLTAETWFRPKYILNNGKHWTNSKKNDRRPLLMFWWPNKSTKRQYIHFMQKHFDEIKINHDLNKTTNQIQRVIEKRIAKEHSTDWLKTLMHKFIKSQRQFNIKSEQPAVSSYSNADGFQGGFFLYGNNKHLKNNTNSKYRLINRNGSNVDGSNKDTNLQEFLLANDVDNSNPIVQSEQLNWMYYLTHFGQITKHGSDANFDSIRIDALDNIDADLTDIYAKYARDIYHTNKNDAKANQHLSIVEGWDDNDARYLKGRGTNYLSLDIRYAMYSSPLTAKNHNGSDLSSLIRDHYVDRSRNYGNQSVAPNYTFSRSHDNGPQDALTQIALKDTKGKVNLMRNPNLSVVKKALSIYKKDMWSTNKEYTPYNLASNYALMLTNKDTVPRIYYGDLYFDGDNYMQTKTPFYDSISQLLTNRVKYVAGGQKMDLQKVHVKTGEDKVLTSVRFGKGANNPKQKGNSLTRSSGIGVVVSNNPNLALKNDDKVILDMGKAHSNQTYRPLMQSTQNGISTYDDSSATQFTKQTNDAGQLILNANDIKGYRNPEVYGYMSVWVPKGTFSNQDVRTKPSQKHNANGKTLHSNPALDSNVIYEGFSNFQTNPNSTTPKDQYTNAIIAKNADLFNRWGITSFELAPQYRSTNDDSFIDAVIKNGYAFNDKYDLGFNKPTKYGTADQLATTIKALHRNNIQVMADFVPNQIYSLPWKQVVDVTRTNGFGVPLPNTKIKNILYAANSLGSGKDYQHKYGGRYLKMLKHRFPNLFKYRQVSNHAKLTDQYRLRTWSAKYFNGTNLQGNGIGYVLKDNQSKKYLNLHNKKQLNQMFK
ncbi:hydrolase [Apilactobacillus apisilvae]|uniref:dextransucrase n=1 Tax=Apilactobacillus apisilvae TaxID=2923364 RepID=A0ABY4PGC1_9LACO|nr:glycoside hydrolase family 70 protein [Apilactobacillus apisilvae]UQS84859.1 hydrolase [Apilactobacillus apisilvae]